jgi:hypothetical protein
MKLFLISFLFINICTNTGAVENNKKIMKTKLKVDADSFYDQAMDYSKFSGRVTDRDATGSIVKVSSETKNIRFFHAGDLVEFKIQARENGDFCQGYVRSIETNYFVMFVKDIAPCYGNTDYFRRGTALKMQSEKLSQRVKEASVYRASLLHKKKDYLDQLNKINQSIWTFEERKIQVAADFDKQILEVEKAKQKSIGEMLDKKNDEIRLQKELIARLDGIDREFDFYRVDKEELLFDRWHLDHDLGPPVYERPEELRPKLEASKD